MSAVTASIDVDLRISTVYNQWTQFEDFPEFMDGVEKVTQRDDTHLHWVAEIGGVRREWEAEITEQEPDQRIAWTSREGIFNSGVVTFDRLDGDSARVTLQMQFEPETFAERAGDALGIVQRQVEGDLKRFKEFIEARGEETGAWRGRV